jgi:hypothetical protein
MKSAVERVFVFSLAPLTLSKIFHGSMVAIVGNTFDNAVTRAAVGTIGKRVVIAAVMGVKNFLETLTTGS